MRVGVLRIIAAQFTFCNHPQNNFRYLQRVEGLNSQFLFSFHFFSTPSTMGTDILSIKSSIWAFSCSSTSGEMNKWVSSRSWKQIFFWRLTGNRTFHLDDKFRAKSELLIKVQKKLKCSQWDENLGTWKGAPVSWQGRIPPKFPLSHSPSQKLLKGK